MYIISNNHIYIYIYIFDDYLTDSISDVLFFCINTWHLRLVWAQDDQDSPFDEAGGWAEALALRARGEAIAVLRDPSVGGHDLGRMLRTLALAL